MVEGNYVAIRCICSPHWLWQYCNFTDTHTFWLGQIFFLHICEYSWWNWQRHPQEKCCKSIFPRKALLYRPGLSQVIPSDAPVSVCLSLNFAFVLLQLLIPEMGYMEQAQMRKKDDILDLLPTTCVFLGRSSVQSLWVYPSYLEVRLGASKLPFGPSLMS